MVSIKSTLFSWMRVIVRMMIGTLKKREIQALSMINKMRIMMMNYQEALNATSKDIKV